MSDGDLFTKGGLKLFETSRAETAVISKSPIVSWSISRTVIVKTYSKRSELKLGYSLSSPFMKSGPVLLRLESISQHDSNQRVGPHVRTY